MSNTWITSDTHFGHTNIITYCNRPYGNAGHMDEDLIRRWNTRVQPDDLIYHLGDVGLTKGEFLADIVGRLAGTKILVLGNHDKSAERMMEFGFDFACEEMVISYFGKRLLLTHRPRRTRPTDIDFVLHGHIHNHSDEHLLQYTTKGEFAPDRSFNINLSVEVTNYEPQSLRSVVSKACFRNASDRSWRPKES